MASAEHTPVGEKQVIVFDLNGTAFGTDVSTVHEITKPDTSLISSELPDFVCGTVRAGEHAVPVIDMRQKLSMPTSGESGEQRVLVVMTGPQQIGWLVDAVTGVFRVTEDEIEPPVRTPGTSEYVSGVAFDEQKPVLLLDPAKVVSAEEAARLSQIANDSQGAA